MKIAVLGSVLASLLLLVALPVSAGMQGWQYQQEIAIQENSGETLHDYQVLVELDGDDFPEEAQSDGDDIRFTDADGHELSYWIEEFDAGSDHARIWVKVPEIPANCEVRIVMWYGNPDAENASDGEAVFEYFDDFKANTIGINWYQDDGTGATIDTSGTGYAKIPQVSGNVLSTKRTFSRPFVAETRVKTDITSRYMAGLAFYDMGTDINKKSYHAFYDSSSINVRYGGSSIVDHIGDAFTPNTGVYYRLVLVLNSNQVISKVYSDDGTIIGQRSISNIDWNDKNLEIDSFGSSSSHFGWFDWFYVRKDTISEPTITLAPPTSATHTALYITKSPSPHSIRQFQETVITLSIKNSGTTDATDIEITDAIHPSFDLTSGDFPNPKRYDLIRPGETRDLQYTISAKESGTFTLDHATVTYADEEGNIQEAKSEPASIKVIPSTESDTAGTSHNPSVSTASVQLHGEKTNVVLGEDILLKLSAVNLITKPIMHVQVIIIPPSGMSVTSSAFAKSGAGQYTTTYELEPGTGKDIEVAIRSNQVGDFEVNGRIIYYFGDDRDDAEDHTLLLPITVRAKAEAGAGAEWTAGTSESEEKGTSTPGFVVVVAIIGLLLAYLRKRA